MNIRRYKKEDYCQVMELHRTAMERIGAFKGNGHWDHDLQNIEDVYNEISGEFLVLETDGKIIAMGAFKKTSETLAEVKRMRVLPEFQGKGFGKLIYCKLEERAKEIGYSGFHLETSEIQVAAQRLYLSVGFKKTGRTIIDGFNCILYEKQF